MEKEFVTYEQALALKELGFDESCSGYWSDWVTQEPFLLTCERGTEKESCTIRRKNFLCSAPTFSQAFRWFREKYEIEYSVSGRKSMGYDFILGGIKISSGGRTSKHSDFVYNTYEKAESACLDKLIGIVKKNS